MLMMACWVSRGFIHPHAFTHSLIEQIFPNGIVLETVQSHHSRILVGRETGKYRHLGHGVERDRDRAIGLQRIMTDFQLLGERWREGQGRRRADS
jgi:hypothetical protein